MAAHRAPPSTRRLPPPAHDVEPDDIIGDFRRGKEIGKGSFATVYLAQHRRKKSYAAVKVVQQSKLNPKLKANLETEIAILKKLQHPHIVALFVCQETPTHFYLIMEYCQLSDLSQFLKKREQLAGFPETADIFRRYPNPPAGGFHEVLSRHFIKQIASALAYLREDHMIHRDIKPQNLLLNPAPAYMSRQRPEDVPLAASERSLVPNVGVQTLPMLKIADFGFARHLPSTSMAETLCGSPLYMAPEILRYEKYDARADLWSTGAVLYELVVGRPPFRAQNHVELLRKIEKAADQITFDNRTMTVSRPMKDLIRKLLKKSPVDRASHDDLLADPVITGDIPGLLDEDRPHLRLSPTAPPEVSELSRRMAKQVIDAPAPGPSPSLSSRRARDDDGSDRASSSRKSSDRDDTRRHSQEMARRKSSTGSQNQQQQQQPPPPSETAQRELQRRSSQREQPERRRPSIVTHATAPGRQDLLAGPGPSQSPPPSSSSAAPKMERRPSRTSPLTGPPMVREPSAVNAERTNGDRALREARERTAQDVAFEKEYVMIEKRQVEVNAFADELDDRHSHARASPQQRNQAPMVRRATTQGHPDPVAGVQPSSPSSRAVMQMVSARPSASNRQRAGSFERRYAPSPQSATNMLTKALNAANVRLFGLGGTSPPPFGGKGPSPPRGYGAYPVYPGPPQGAASSSDDKASKRQPMDEDSRVVRTMEEAAHRSDVIFGFAEVKYRQLLPATPSAAQDGLGIQQIGAPDRPTMGRARDDEGPEGRDDDDDDGDMTTVAIVGVAEEALVLYVKTLAILKKSIDLAGHWWSKQQTRVDREPFAAPVDAVPRPATSPTTTTTTGAGSDVGRRMNNVVQWARDRFNECLHKSEIVKLKLHAAQKLLPPDHPGRPSDDETAAAAASDHQHQIPITTGVTAEKLMFDRAVEMSRAAAVGELVNEDPHDLELRYVTAILLLEAVLEVDDEPLMPRPGSGGGAGGARGSQLKALKAGPPPAPIEDPDAESGGNGMLNEDRATVVRLIEGARVRLTAIRKRAAQSQLHQHQQQQQQQQTTPPVGSGNVTPKAAGVVGAAAPAAVSATAGGGVGGGLGGP